jgi:hypothetical protein
MKPKIEAVQYSNRKEYRAGHKKSPEGLAEAGEDVCEPCGEASPADDVSHFIAP